MPSDHKTVKIGDLFILGGYVSGACKDDQIVLVLNVSNIDYKFEKNVNMILVKTGKFYRNFPFNANDMLIALGS